MTMLSGFTTRNLRFITTGLDAFAIIGDPDTCQSIECFRIDTCDHCQCPIMGANPITLDGKGMRKELHRAEEMASILRIMLNKVQATGLPDEGGCTDAGDVVCPSCHEKASNEGGTL